MSQVRTADFRDSNNNGVDDRDENNKSKAPQQKAKEKAQGRTQGQKRRAELRKQNEDGAAAAKNMDFNQVGKGKVTAAEMTYMRNQGATRQERYDQLKKAEADGIELGSKAQNLIKTMDTRKANKTARQEAKERAQKRPYSPDYESESCVTPPVIEESE